MDRHQLAEELHEIAHHIDTCQSCFPGDNYLAVVALACEEGTQCHAIGIKRLSTVLWLLNTCAAGAADDIHPSPATLQ